MCKLLIAFSFLGVIGASVGQILQNGQCDPNINLFQNFNVEEFLGTWYELARTDTALGGDCSTIELTRAGEGIAVSHNTIRQNFFQEYVGTASVAEGTARLTLSLPQASNNPIDFWVINTDYTTFALTYGCENVGTVQRRVYLWQLGRANSFPNQLVQAMLNTAILNLFGITSAELYNISHENDACFILPILEPGSPVIFSGQCDQSISGVANFDAARFLGVWHEVSSYYSENALGTCSRAHYTDGGDRVNVVNSQVINQRLLTIGGYATVTSNDNSGQLNVVLEVAPGVTAESELLVLATDYENWAVTYTCNNLENNQRRVFSWVVSRTRQLSAASQTQVNAVIGSILELNDNYYETTDQSDTSCFYFPEPVANEPVIFGGQCDMTIPAVANFQAANYMGLWHEIERYPTPFQFGTCHNAFYEIVNGVVEVFNTQVVNEALVSINGQAVPTGTDGKLVVTFPIQGTDLTTETDYWVLSTDYTSYSLVYSCRNINEYQQQVTVWKLSRSKTLSTAAAAAIDAVIATQDVLSQNYFTTADQSVTGCFYYPEPQPGAPVVFPGQCETNIPVVANFNTAQWQGQWFEVEAYPKSTQPGKCVNHLFSTGTGTSALNLVSSNVADQLLGTNNGNLVFYTGETGGRFTLSMDGGISFPYYVIATDYTDYALVYSCLNINSDFREVYAWKLSRTKQLSTNANTQITNALSNSVVLGSQYFEPMDQSDDACFYFPDLAPGEPVIMPGTCDADIPVMQNFNIDAYLGRWRLLERYPADNQIGECNQATYSAGSDGTITVYNNEVVDQTLREITGSAISSETNGRLLITFPNGNSFEMWILDTDYESYSIAYGCENISNEQRRVWSWKLSRTTSFSAAAIAAMDTVINNVNVLNQRYFQTVDHSDAACFYYPTPGSGPTIFRGQCDTNIPVVTNFDAQAYMGLWHDIESYAVPFQDGSCPNAFYTLDTTLGRVDVFNTQVLSQTLDTINGYAVLEASTDGSAKLVVTFPSVGPNLATPYWVLATDYTSYALVYSCQNIDDEHRTVSSWKLSRNKSLTAAATTAINNIVNSIQVLDTRYYNVRDHSPEGCFYFPEPQPGVPVTFPGQCDENIPVVSNFNLDQFQGMWYEIDTYPKDTQPGECINHAFSAGSTNQALSFVSTNVQDQLLGTTNGQVTLYPNQSNGRLTLTMTDSSGSEISFPYYVIATDYNDYALVYSCMNLNSDYRGIWSWKLSRNRQQLSTAANLAINNAMTNIDVLSNDYFETVDQSDDACFYFPDLAPGEPVIMPGTCDADIPVVQNFNIDAYLGRWRLLESYPVDNQIGECNQATYSTGSDGTITVYNNEVVAQSLREITGSATLAAQIGGETNGKLILTFPNGNSFELWILDTDYVSYSIAYGCENISNEQRRVWSWKLSRTTSFSAAAIAAMDTVINNVNVLNQRYFQTVDHSDAACFYYPTPGSGPTIFRGQCDTNIPVVTNFDAQAYMGLWHDIESYAVPFQDGSCPNAFYTLDTTLGRVDVFNTQVLSQTLDTINGYAVLEASTDGSAKLVVTFPSVGPNLATPYWVLATDYTSYALVYSCQNIDDEHRTVSSWKLSRNKSLTAAATTAINNIVNSIQVLDTRYYNVRDHSPEGCFYFPEPQPGVPVTFPGQCDENIPVVSNFNLDQFQGMWYEMDTYPKDTQPGECINHAFSAGSTNQALSFVSTNVMDQLLGTTNGQVTLYPNQSNGRLTLTMTDSSGSEISFPYYVIATDYNDYALVYSCMNLNSDYRGIWSWKLSRNRQQLSTAANLAINNAMTNIDVLSNDYFETVDQSDDACFYFPDLAPGEPVIMPGTCDADIPVVQNFNIDAYLGRWRLLESYPADNQIGACNQATYSTGSDGTITFYNNEVVAQGLREITGSATLAAQIGGETNGKLILTFPNGNSFELWILDTDYVSYSIAYGCENISNEQRRVWSWKLSRTTSFSAAAIAAMDTVINNVNVLNQRYFQTVDHSDAACFYYPTPGSGPTIFRGQCDTNIPVVTNFDAQAYMGLWHDIESYAVPFQDGSCPNAFYTLDTTLGRVDVFNTQVLSQTLDTINGYAVLEASTDGSAKLVVTFPSVGPNLATPYWVLATDYTSYALVYSCQNIDDERRTVSSWKLSRNKSLTAAATTTINNIVNSIQVLDARYYNVRDQSPEGCFYFPEPQPGVPVVFPGQCDENVPVVNNFDLNQFAGIWHEVETYPKVEQTGDCINHRFTVNGNALDMQSLNVIAESLGITSGTVTFAYNDNTARMTIRFTSNGQVIEIPYWIVDTDYNNYALAYSCVNQNADYRGIWSWKLSRTKQLTAASDTAIDQAIANIDVLDNTYFERVDQTDEACFFYPQTSPGEAVVFPGQCDASISGVQNFDAGRYLGLWRTIEAYPSDFQVGTCGDAYYSLGDGVVDVYNTEVVNQALSTINGTAVVASTDGTGKLLVTFPDAPFPIEYVILDTDYDTYSLVYSCVNINSDQRRVFSWKLSRTNSLPQNAVTAISNIVNSINVLDERYYEAEDRTPDGCFYYPEPNPPASVIFRGQCNENIAVVSNFDAVAYTGEWYSIESYPAPFQGGTCGTAKYTLNTETGVVFVENTQVLDQMLDVQTGTAVLTDGTNGKLAVTFEVNGVSVTTDYWVLATDYTSYSLVYSCQNINEEYKQVNSWKLSRTQQLPATAVPAINAVINNVQVLDQQYFVPEGRSEVDCFFYPDNNGGDVVLDGQCVPDNQVPAITNFNVNLFAGQWHEVSRFPSDLQVGECAAADFSLGASDSLTITQTIVNNEFETTSVIPGAVSSDGRGVISATVAGVPFDYLYILATDYTEYALIYGCRELENNQKQIYSWKLARSRAGLSAAANSDLDEIVSSNIDLFERYYSNTEQTNDACFHYPEFEELPGSIELPGPCDETIRGVPNFNAAAYTGRWVEIERYPQANQFGTCDRAYYTAGTDNVLVRNTQVVDEALLEQLGSAVVSSNDNSGLLEVTFNVNGVEVNANYYVLATDYTNYALVYSCRNAAGNTRLVSSWKLSRTTSLSAQANAAINAVIAQTQGLSQQYYQTTSQTVEDCFYIPDVNPDVAPLYRGQCESVNGVENFNAEAYVGWWHEMQRFPVDYASGECISSNYVGSGSTYQVVDTTVANGTADIVTGTVTVTADGRLRRVLSNGLEQEIVVLATDYSNYALLYSCEDVDILGEAYRRVWSAKHSKTRLLTDVDEAAMAPMIANSNILYDRFYFEVDHSDQACFHYPEVSGQRVILPGQCDENIPVVADFDVAAYGGTWYQIERYPQVHEDPSATCTGARYILNAETGEVQVLNWEVIDGVLETIEGVATLASDDGSAKLSVVLPIVGTNETVETSLYVLATDYEDYSLVYSCSNINDFQRSIGAWKLSRGRTLSPEGATAIEARMATREELDARYFLQVEQNEECEEPSAGALVKSSVIVMLVCAVIQLLY